MKRPIYLSFLYVCFTLTFTSCLQERTPVGSSPSTNSWFEGVVSAKNRGGPNPSILVSWNSSSFNVASYRIYSLIYDPVTKTNQEKLIDSVSSDTTTYLYSDSLMPGALYTFMVRAVNTSDQEDSNNKHVSTVAFAGIANVSIRGTTTALISLDSPFGSFDEVRIYAQPEREGAIKKKVATIKGQAQDILVSGLQSGVKYKFSANAYMAYLNAEDGNDYTISAQTISESFGSGLSDEDTSAYKYRGMLNVQAYGDSPHAPVAPRSRMTRLTWLPFAGANSTTKYRVVRAEHGTVVNASTTQPCAATVKTSCIVACLNSGPTTQTCEDLLVGSAPITYNYVVTLLKSDTQDLETWPEELPSSNASDFYTKVAIPPDNMVLVQRNAANYEMCQMLGTKINPRKYQRCEYTGIAAVPHNSGPGKPALNLNTAFYDFGYNLFVDRFPTGCNWTRVSASCGSNGCVGITSATSSSADPSNSLGNNGDVFFAQNPSYGNNCYIKKNNTWLPVASSTSNLTAAEYQSATTMDPANDYKTPAINGAVQQTAYNICSSHPTPYGAKRLLRRREYVQASAFATIANEPNAIASGIQEWYLRSGFYDTATSKGGQKEDYRRCASNNQNYLLAAPTTLSSFLDISNLRSQINSGLPSVLNFASLPYYIGTVATSACISRWGAQDITVSSGDSNSNIIFSDTLRRTNDIATDPATFAPIDSDFDSGVVRDWYNNVLTYQFSGSLGPVSGTSASYFADQEFNATTASTVQSFILPLGLPLTPATTLSSIYAPYKTMSSLVNSGALGSRAYGVGTNASSHVIYRWNDRSVMNILKFFVAQGMQHRFSYTIAPETGTTRFGVRCALEAE